MTQAEDEGKWTCCIFIVYLICLGVGAFLHQGGSVIWWAVWFPLICYYCILKAIWDSIWNCIEDSNRRSAQKMDFGQVMLRSDRVDFAIYKDIVATTEV